MIKPYNVIIAGVGGQGVFSLTRVIWKLCEKMNIQYQGSTFKGGAQRLGTIHSTLRIFLSDDPNYSLYSSQIPEGELDAIIGLEPWETLRYNKYFGENTKIVLNTNITPLFMQRHKSFEMENPLAVIEKLNLSVLSHDYTSMAIKRFGTKKMVNYLIGQEATRNNILPFSSKDFTITFLELIKMSSRIKTELKKTLTF